MPRKRRKPPRTVAHFGAPAAFLAAVTIAVLLVHSGLSHDSGQPTGPVTTVRTQSTTTATTTAGAKKHAKRSFAVVQTGDTFGSIASRQGISVEQLQALNPGVSSTALQVGQKLRVK
jgi:LysM repeat protein